MFRNSPICFSSHPEARGQEPGARRKEPGIRTHDTAHPPTWAADTISGRSYTLPVCAVLHCKYSSTHTHTRRHSHTVAAKCKPSQASQFVSRVTCHLFSTYFLLNFYAARLLFRVFHTALGRRVAFKLRFTYNCR